MLRTVWIALSLLSSTVLAVTAAWPCQAQEPRVRPHVPSAQDTQGVLTPTPEMWFYEQERLRHDDPKMAIRLRAEVRAQQRQDRLASLYWFGMSNSRPSVSCAPFTGSYSAYWASNSFDPLRWRQTTYPLVVMRPRDAY